MMLLRYLGLKMPIYEKTEYARKTLLYERYHSNLLKDREIARLNRHIADLKRQLAS